MTLIITARSKSFALVTADGRCTITTKGVQQKATDTLQKIFPYSDRGFAIAHHGQNLIDERRVDDITNQFLNGNADVIAKSSLQHIAQIFAERYGQSVKETLEKIPDSKHCGFLFIGFGVGGDEPRIYEANWHKKEDTNIDHNIKLLGDFVRSGEGKKYIDEYLKDLKNLQFLKENILKWNLQQTKAYCDKLYGFAENNQTKAGEDIFGGYKHQLVIKKSGCEWLIPPKQASPTAAGQ